MKKANPEPDFPFYNSILFYILHRMKLIVGLGNPGKQYQNTRHNVGYLIIEKLFDAWREDKKFKSVISNIFLIPSQFSSVVGMKPETFMNLSGDAVSAFVSFYKLDPQKDILVISDDIDMVFGKVRYRKGGSHGGQNGLRDIISKLGTDEFARIKIGIGRDDRYNISDWVLSGFVPNERMILETEVLQKVQEYINTWLGD